MRRIMHVILGIGLVLGGAFLGARVSGSATPNSVWAEDAKKEPINVQYARLFLQQSQLDLERALEINRRTPGSFQTPIVDSLRQSVILAENWLKEAQARNGSTEYNPTLATAEALAKIASDDFAKIVELSKMAPRSVNAKDLERAKVAAELAQVRVAQAKELDLKSPTAVMQWQIDQLREQVVELYTHVAKLQARN